MQHTWKCRSMQYTIKCSDVTDDPLFMFEGDEANAPSRHKTHLHARKHTFNRSNFLSRSAEQSTASVRAGIKGTHSNFVLVRKCIDTLCISLLFLVLVLNGVLLIVLLWVIRLPSAGRENVLIPLIPSTHHHLACRRRGML